MEFKIGNPKDWEYVVPGEAIAFDVPEETGRKVHFDVLASALVAVRADTGDATALVGAGAGMFGVTIPARDSFTVTVLPADDREPVVYIRTGRELQTVPESEEPSYTTIQPRGVQLSDEMRRMMGIVKVNAQRREEVLREELRRLESRLNAPVAAG